MSDQQTSILWNCATAIGSAALSHPFTYVKVLAQIGHEPLPSANSSLYAYLRLGPQKCYPNAFGYLKHIRNEDGFFGMYKGFGARICYDLVFSVATAEVSQVMVKWKTDRKDAEIIENEWMAWNKFVIDTSLLSASHMVGIVAAYPFHVLMVRVMAQFVGKETLYDNPITGFNQLFNERGVGGFFLGLVPRLIGELVTIWISNTLYFIYKRYGKNTADKIIGGPPSAINAVCQLVAAQSTFQFISVSTVMIVNGTKSLVAGVEPIGKKTFSGWFDCWNHLCLYDAQNRGKSLFLRAEPGRITVID